MIEATDVGIYDINIKRGATLRIPFTWLDENDTIVPLLGYDARMQIRPQIGSDVLYLDLNVGNGRIIINTTTNEFQIYLTSAETDAIQWNKAVYDFETVSPAGDIDTLLAGKVTVTDVVTQ